MQFRLHWRLKDAFVHVREVQNLIFWLSDAEKGFLLIKQGEFDKNNNLLFTCIGYISYLYL